VEIKNDQREKKRLKYEAVIWHDNVLPDRFYAARIFNISRSGLYFESDQTLYEGEEIYIAHKNPGLTGINSEDCSRVEIKWRQNLQNSAYRYGYGAKFQESVNPLVKSIDKSKLIGQNIQDNHAKFKNEPRAHLRELYRKEIVFITKDTEYKGLVTDISRGGAFIQTKTKMSLGQMINLYIQGDQSCKDVNIKGWVVRLSPNGIGVKFDRRLRSDRRKSSNRRERKADIRKSGS
jgi:Tfp pilus assembly protein PilZ